MASTGILNSVWSTIGLKKPPDYPKSDDSCSSRSPPMVESTNISLQKRDNRGGGGCGGGGGGGGGGSVGGGDSSGRETPNPIGSLVQHHQNNYLTTAMLLGAQTCGYLGQRLANNNLDTSSDTSTTNNSFSQRSSSSAPNPSSLFTIDSILASKPNSLVTTAASHHHHHHHLHQRQRSESPSNNSSPSPVSSPVRPTRVPAILHHPGLHLGHLAAAAASGFGTTSDFLGEFLYYFFFFYVIF